MYAQESHSRFHVLPPLPLFQWHSNSPTHKWAADSQWECTGKCTKVQRRNSTWDYRVSHVLVDQGWVDLDLGTSPGWWAATVATYCTSRMVEHPKSKSTKPSLRGHGTPCTVHVWLEVSRLHRNRNSEPRFQKKNRFICNRDSLEIRPGIFWHLSSAFER